MSWWVYEGLRRNKMLHFEVIPLINIGQHCCGKTNSATDSATFDRKDSENTNIAIVQLTHSANVDRKGQSSWSDAATRCTNEGDLRLAVIT